MLLSSNGIGVHLDFFKMTSLTGMLKKSKSKNQRPPAVRCRRPLIFERRSLTGQVLWGINTVTYFK
jgi:hypothetical protein